LEQAVEKFKKLAEPKASFEPILLEKMLMQLNRQYKSRFVVKNGDLIHAVPVEEVLYFFSEEKIDLFGCQAK
jgi:DNA-binding LytR/AlgR family response regulator